MRIEDYQDSLAGQTVVIIGNGEGLLNIPPAFLMHYSNFAMNFFPMKFPWMHIDHWCALDPLCMSNIPRINKGTPRFVSPWGAEKAIERGWLDDRTLPVMLQDKIKGLGWGDGTQRGTRYSTTLLYASHLAIYMGAKVILWVGFDCTFKEATASKIDEDVLIATGESHIPHFYDRQPGAFQNSWCLQAGKFYEWAKERDVEVWNCSIPTMCDSVPLGDYRDYWSPPDQRAEL